MTSSDLWTREQAATYDDPTDPANAPEAIVPTVALLAELAGGGRALELAIGTGRVAVPLLRAGVEVAGIELSEPMVEVLRGKVSADELPVTVGDMASADAPGGGGFSLVYLVYNTISNLLTQDEQVACFANAARHLAPGGRFLIEVGVPSLRSLPPTAQGVVFDAGPEHFGIDTYDPVTQAAISHHLSVEPDGRYRYGIHHFRYVWPSECDLMARLAGLTLEARYADWDRSPFTAESTSHVSVWRKPAA